MNNYSEEFDNLDPDKKKKHSILDKLNYYNDDDYTSTFSMSGFLDSRAKEAEAKEEEKRKKKDERSEDLDEWISSISVFSKKDIRGKYTDYDNDLFAITGKKKKKKKKKDGDLVDYKKEFEPEMALYRNLMIQQNRFTTSLQKNYDAIANVKSTNRGLSKQMTDLMKNITEARALSMQLVEKNVNAKKLIAELNLKQKKEFGSGIEGANMSDFASNMLKQMVNERGNNGDNGVSDSDIMDYDDDVVTDVLFNELAGNERSDDVENFIKYANKNITEYAVVHNNDANDFEMQAIDEDGNILDDYPLPDVSNIRINTSTNLAIDQYGRKYPVKYA